MALLALPATAASNKPPTHPGKRASGPTGPSGPSGASGPSGKAYGYYCRNESKTHVPGQKGTPFSQCVTAMAKLKTGKAQSPQTACATLSKKHVTGEKGTPYSRCVSAGAQLLRTTKHG